MNNAVFIKHLGSTVHSWLNYISAVGRDFVLSESSIKLPLAEFIGTNIAKTDAIKLEFPHPNFFMKRMDLYYKREISSFEISTAFEFKYIKNASTIDDVGKHSVFYDLMRLHTFIVNSTIPAEGYFLICGKQFEFDLAFQKITTNLVPVGPRSSTPVVIPKQSGFYTEWFKFDYDDPDQIITLNGGKPDYKGIYEDFFKNYNTPFENKMGAGRKIPTPNEIKTKLIFLSQDNSQKDVPDSMKVGIWQVLV